MSLLWRSDAQCHGMGKWVHVGSQNNPWVALGVKDPWISFHRLQTLDEQACGDRCKALKARMMNGAEIKCPCFGAVMSNAMAWVSGSMCALKIIHGWCEGERPLD